MAIKAFFYDGKTSRQRSVMVYPERPDHLRVVGENVEFSWALSEVRPSSRVGNTRRHLYFPDGSQCETEDNDAVDELFAQLRTQTLSRLLYRWESRLGYVISVLVLTGLLLWAGITWGIPALAKRIAFSLPAATERTLGGDWLDRLDKVYLVPSRLQPERQREMQALFSRIVANVNATADYRIELRSTQRIGANALALPSGIVVVTDQLVELAKDDGELIAVFAHEVGHLKQRHALRYLLQNSVVTLLFIAISGKFSSETSLSDTLSTQLLLSSFSRDFEREADDFAIDYMNCQCIPTEFFAEILLRMEVQKGIWAGKPDYLSSHPATRERVERIRATN